MISISNQDYSAYAFGWWFTNRYSWPAVGAGGVAV